MNCRLKLNCILSFNFLHDDLGERVASLQLQGLETMNENLMIYGLNNPYMINYLGPS